jgi:hypothetical protein
MKSLSLNYHSRDFTNVKGIGSILFLKNGLKKKIAEKTLKIISEVCTAVALCFPNIEDVVVLQTTNLSSDRNRTTVVVV